MGTDWCCEPSPDLLLEFPRALMGALEAGSELGVEVRTKRLCWQCDEGVELDVGGLAERLGLDRLPRRDL